MLASLFKAAVGLVIETPLAAAADVLTLGGAITDRHELHTVSALKRVVQNVERSTEPKRS